MCSHHHRENCPIPTHPPPLSGLKSVPEATRQTDSFFSQVASARCSVTATGTFRAFSGGALLSRLFSSLWQTGDGEGPETWPTTSDLAWLGFSVAGSYASPGLVNNSVVTVDCTLEGAGTKWRLRCSPGSGLTAPAADARTVTRRGQLSVWKMPGCVSFLFRWPQLPHLENGGEMREAAHGHRHRQGVTEAVCAGNQGAQATGLNLLLEGDKVQPARTSWFPLPVILSLQALVSV